MTILNPNYLKSYPNTISSKPIQNKSLTASNRYKHNNDIVTFNGKNEKSPISNFIQRLMIIMSLMNPVTSQDSMANPIDPVHKPITLSCKNMELNEKEVELYEKKAKDLLTSYQKRLEELSNPDLIYEETLKAKEKLNQTKSDILIIAPDLNLDTKESIKPLRAFLDNFFNYTEKSSEDYYQRQRLEISNKLSSNPEINPHIKIALEIKLKQFSDPNFVKTEKDKNSRELDKTKNLIKKIAPNLNIDNIQGVANFTLLLHDFTLQSDQSDPNHYILEKMKLELQFQLIQSELIRLKEFHQNINSNCPKKDLV